MSVNERIKLVIGMHNLSASEFAEKIGVQRSAVSHLLSGRNKPSIDVVERIVNAFPRVDAYWLITGKQSKEETGYVKQDFQPAPAPEEITGNEKIERIVIFFKDGSYKEYSN